MFCFASGAQMGVVCAQQPLESELLQRCQQLQSRLSTLKIENEEVRGRLRGSSEGAPATCSVSDRHSCSSLRLRKQWRPPCAPSKTW